MTKNAAKIKKGIRTLSFTPNEIISGTVIPGSLNEDTFTISIQPTNDSAAIENIMLNPVTENENGMILFPADNSTVVIGSVEGQGEWVLIKASEIKKAIITIENVVYEMDNSQVNIQNEQSVFNISSGMFKMNTASESLYQLLKDLLTAITTLTVTNSAGASGVPNNVADFTNLLLRLNNLLTA